MCLTIPLLPKGRQHFDNPRSEYVGDAPFNPATDKSELVKPISQRPCMRHAQARADSLQSHERPICICALLGVQGHVPISDLIAEGDVPCASHNNDIAQMRYLVTSSVHRQANQSPTQPSAEVR